MDYLSKLNQEEINRLCEIIPYDIVKFYFSNNSKQFAKILPGFRPKSLSENRVKNLLKHNYKKHFISSFIENNVQIWLREIEEAINNEREKRKSDFVIQTIILAQSFFSNNVSAYYKLIESDYSQEKITLISDMVAEMVEMNKQTDKLNRVLEDDKKAIESLSDELDKCKKAFYESKNAEKSVKRLEKEIERNNKKVAEAKSETYNVIKKLEKAETENESLKAKVRKQKSQLKVLEQEKFDLLSEISKGKYAKKLALKEISGCSNVMAPVDEDGFVDDLSCNFIYLGLDKDFDYPNMLAVFIYKSICCGKPLLIKKKTAPTLIKCLSNALEGKQNFDNLCFEPSIDENDIITFLNDSGRIVLLDNFIGNYNETVLISILEKYKNKIVFLSTSYDGTLKYLSDEIFDYCTYMSIEGISCFEDIKFLNEQPSIFDEDIVECSVENNIFTRKLDKICAELSIPFGIVGNGKRYINDQSTFVGYLYFSLIPFCNNVLKINPFSHSITLQKQFGENGKFGYKKLFKKWYINE